jgi:predicted amidophosphoribosyltransferase
MNDPRFESICDECSEVIETYDENEDNYICDECVNKFVEQYKEALEELEDDQE